MKARKSVREIVTSSRRLGVKALTVYAFSEQNWARPEEEVGALMELLAEYIVSERDTLLNNSIRFRAIGRTAAPARAHPASWSTTSPPSRANNEGMTLSICLSYGGREEVADAAQELARRVQRGEMSLDDVNEPPSARILPIARRRARWTC